MPNLNQLILTGGDYKIMLIINGGGSYPILTAETLDYDDSSEGETVWGIGSEDPIGEKSNNNKFSGSLSLQAGELNAILLIEGMKSAIQIRNATLALTAVVGGFSKVWGGVNINKAKGGAKRKDKETLTALDFAALSIT